MLLFSTHITPRLNYIVAFVSKELFDEPVKIIITTDKEAFTAATGRPRINYSPLPIPDCFTLRPSGLLSEFGIHPIKIECFVSGNKTAFFPTDGDFPFDLFSAAFFLLSRYEEYLPHPKDEYAAASRILNRWPSGRGISSISP